MPETGLKRRDLARFLEVLLAKKARLETTLCIRCKEDQERLEKAYG